MATRLTIVDGNNNDKDNVRVYMVKGEKGGATWGQIDGIVSDQTDINAVIDTKIETELANFDHLDYEVVDTIPTPATAEEGVRYLYKPAGATAYNEYILINGVIYMIGTTEDVNLENYYNKTEIDDKIKNTKQTTGTSIDTYSTDYLNKALQRHILYAEITGVTSLGNDATVPLKEVWKIGDKLSVSNNKIVVGAGVKKVKVSWNLTYSAKAGTDTNFWGATVTWNDNGTYQLSRRTRSMNNTPLDLTSGDAIYSVNEGDTFGLRVFFNASGSYNVALQTWITVEVVE